MSLIKHIIKHSYWYNFHVRQNYKQVRQNTGSQIFTPSFAPVFGKIELDPALIPSFGSTQR